MSWWYVDVVKGVSGEGLASDEVVEGNKFVVGASQLPNRKLS